MTILDHGISPRLLSDSFCGDVCCATNHTKFYSFWDLLLWSATVAESVTRNLNFSSIS